jgi:hypothetical protein
MFCNITIHITLFSIMKKTIISRILTRGGVSLAVVALGLFGYLQSAKTAGSQTSSLTLNKLAHLSNANAEGTITCSGLASGCTVLANIGGVIVPGTVNGYKN